MSRSEKRDSSKSKHRSDKDRSDKSEKKSSTRSSKPSSSCPPPCPPPCPQPCPPPCSAPCDTGCPQPCPTECNTSCGPCPPPNPCPPKDVMKWCDFTNVCSSLSACLPKGMWCDTMSCLVPCGDKVYKITDTLSVRVNLYCNPLNDVVTFNSVPVFGCMDIPKITCPSSVIDQVAGVACAWACPITLSIYEKLRTYPDLSVLVSLLDVPIPDPLPEGFVDVKAYLQNPCSTATLFAPNNSAFTLAAEERGETLEEFFQFLVANPAVLNEILRNHILPKVYFSAAFKKGQATKLLALSKECLTVCKSKESPYTVYVSSDVTKNAKVLDADILATNGTIHIIDKVLEPILE